MEQPISGFEMLEKLGQGGMASVWKARQISLDRIVAIKILSDRFASDPEDVEMFQKEARQAARLKHPGIVQVYDANVENGFYFIVMEFVAGYTVGDWIRRKDILSEKDALLVAECVADALEYAWNHSRIIHCDIKPDNIIIDDDGTVKIADLGLARTISAMTEEEESEEVMGTPAYIAPEQAMGKSDMDFRADIYSLGAMLYHLATGHLLFEDSPDENVMELQVTHSVPDPLDLNPELSKPFCWMIEKMLAKEPDARPSSWEEVRKDIERVKRKIMPLNCLADGDSSTVQRSPMRTQKDLKEAIMAEKGRYRRSGMLKAAVLLVLMFAAVGAYRYFMGPDSRSRGEEPAVSHDSGGTGKAAGKGKSASPSGQQTEKQAKEMYDFACQWIKENPRKFAAGIDRMNKVATQTGGTKYALMAQDEIRRLKVEWRKAKEKVMTDLAEEAEYFINNGELEYAAGLYEDYDGHFRHDTKDDRIAMAGKLRARHKAMQEEAVRRTEMRKRKYQDALENTAIQIIEEGLDSALDVLSKALADGDLSSHRPDFLALQKVLQGAARMDGRILDTFKKDIGKVITVGLEKEPRKMIIDEVKDGKVCARQQYGSSRAMMSVTFTVHDLCIKERLARMGDDEAHDVALVKGLMALESGSEKYARTFFEKTHPLISGQLIASLDNAREREFEKEAHTALVKGLSDLGIKVGNEFDEWEWGAAVENSGLSGDAVGKAQDFVKQYKDEYGNTKFCRQADPVLEALQGIKVKSDASARPSKEPGRRVALRKAAMERTKPAGEGAEAAPREKVVDELLQKNYGVLADEIQVFKDSSGHIYRLNIYSAGIRDISPVAQLKHLREFYCGGVEPENTVERDKIAPLTDISVLSSLPLEKIYIGQTRVESLEPIANLKLKGLDARRTRVTDITPLKYMDIESLNLEGTMVRDISVMARMASIKELNLNGIRAFDFKPIARKPITRLWLNDTQFRDLSVLRGMPLRLLFLANTKVSNISALSSFELVTLSLGNTAVRDISPLKGMNLRTLVLSGTKVDDCGALAGMPLRRLYLSGTSIDDLEHVKGLELTTLDISGTDVQDLAPLARMTTLKELIISSTKVTNLAPLSRLELVHLGCHNVQASFMPIQSMKLQSISVDHPEHWDTLGMLLRMPFLKKINGEPKMYWKMMANMAP